MYVCMYKPLLLCSDLWFIKLLLKQTGNQDIKGASGLNVLLMSDQLKQIDFNSTWFRTIFEKENNFKNISGWTPLMSVCAANRWLLDNDYWFIETLLI